MSSYIDLSAGDRVPGYADIISPACPDGHNELLRELPSRYTHITDHAMQHNEWRNLFTRKSWMDGASSQQTVIFRTHFLDDDAANWNNSFGDDCYRSCNYESDEIDMGQETRTMSLNQRRLTSPHLCLEKLRDKFDRARVTRGFAKSLSENLIRSDRDFVRASFINASPYYYASAGGPTRGAGRGNHPRNGSPIPDHSLSLGLLTRMFRHLKVGRALSSAVATRGGQKLLPMYLSAEAYDTLCHEDPKLYEQKLETAPQMLNGPWVSSYGDSLNPVKHFIPRIIEEPRRWTINQATGAWIRVQPFVTVPGASGGKYSDPNPQYEDPNCAPFEEVYFPNPNSGCIRVPDEIRDFGAGFNFDPQNYTGNIVPRNIIDRDCNPDGNQIYLQGTLIQGYEVLEEDAGATLLIKRHWYDNGIEQTWKPNCTLQSAARIPIVGCCQYSNTSLFLSFNAAIDESCESFTIQFGWNGDNRKATLIGLMPLDNDPYRYAFEFNEPVDCGCPITDMALTCDADCAIPSNSDGGDGCCPELKEPLACEAGEAVEGYTSVLVITLDPVPDPAPAVGDAAFVNLGSQIPEGEVLAYADGVVTIGFVGCDVACDSGDGVCSVAFQPSVVDTPKCYDFPLDGAMITAFEDGEATLANSVPAVTCYDSVAHGLNCALGDRLFYATECGVCYCGEGTPGPLTIGDAVVEPSEACAEGDDPKAEPEPKK